MNILIKNITMTYRLIKTVMLKCNIVSRKEMDRWWITVRITLGIFQQPINFVIINTPLSNAFILILSTYKTIRINCLPITPMIPSITIIFKVNPILMFLSLHNATLKYPFKISTCLWIPPQRGSKYNISMIQRNRILQLLSSSPNRNNNENFSILTLLKISF